MNADSTLVAQAVRSPEAIGSVGRAVSDAGGDEEPDPFALMQAAQSNTATATDSVRRTNKRTADTFLHPGPVDPDCVSRRA